MGQEPKPPSKVLRELVAAGVLDPKTVRMPPSDRCRCGHVSGAHDHLGPCFAHRCPCKEYAQDPAYDYIPGQMTVRKIRANVSGEMTGREEMTVRSV